ncbi:MAG: carbohydrate kinase [Roseobacter sp.]
MILCCGEALIDMIPSPTKAGADGFVPHSGGAIFNTAIGLGRLGSPTGFLTGLSSDLFGKQLRQDLAASNVDASFAISSDLPTTLAFVRLNKGHATYTFYDENTAGRSLTPDVLPSLPEDISALYFGGISLISEPCADFYAALAEQETKTRIIALDPNIRPSFIRDETRYRARLSGMISAADILKVSDEDLDWISPGSDPENVKIAALLEQGPSLIIITRGSSGASGFLANGDQIDVPAPKATVIDTVGAGDTFNSGVLNALHTAGILEKTKLSAFTVSSVKAALERGAEVAAVTVSRAGANPPWAKELVK